MTTLEKVMEERKHQDAKWGGPSHDDKHTTFDWIAHIVRHLGRSAQYQGVHSVPPMSMRGSVDRVVGPEEVLEIFRAEMIKVAAVAIAASESASRGLERIRAKGH